MGRRAARVFVAMMAAAAGCASDPIPAGDADAWPADLPAEASPADLPAEAPLADVPAEVSPADLPGEAPSGDTPADVPPGDLPGEETPVPFPELDPAACRVADPADLLGFEAGYDPPDGAPVLQDKAWFLWSVVMHVPEARAAVEADPALATRSAERTAAFRDAAITCADDAGCHAARLDWSEEDLAAVAKDLARVLAATTVVGAHLRPSGRFALHATLDDGGLVAQATVDGLATLASAVRDHALSRADRAALVSAASGGHPGDLLFFEPLLHLALAGLDADAWDQAARFEPLAEGENAAAQARVAGLRWDEWRFTVILVPGWGPDALESPLSDTGREHCDIAVERWKAGLAPFLLLSGGAVHPEGTPYFEAIEMKKYLREAHGVPEDALLVDPHARHTTTNVRNAARLMLRTGIPPDRPALVSTDFLQAPYITALGDRCLEELGYLPWRSMAALSPYDDCFLPAPVSLHADASDPRDP